MVFERLMIADGDICDNGILCENASEKVHIGWLTLDYL